MAVNNAARVTHSLELGQTEQHSLLGSPRSPRQSPENSQHREHISVSRSTSLTGIYGHMSPRSEASLDTSPRSSAILPGNSSETPVSIVTGTTDVTLPRNKSRETRKLHLWAPTAMVTLLIAGIAISIGHHFYYNWLDGQMIQSADKQQWALRLGNAFAFAAKCCFCSATSISFTQWLWRSVRQRYITIQGIDAAFSANQTILSFFSREMILNMKIPSLFALVTWAIPLVALFAPATLSVKADITRSVVNASVSIPVIPWFTDAPIESFSRWVTFVGDESQLHEDSGREMGGPSARFAKLILSTATTAQLFSIPQPFKDADSSYIVEIISPTLQCGNCSSDMPLDLAISALRSPESERRYSSINTSTIDMENLRSKDERWYTTVGYFSRISSLGDDSISQLKTSNELQILIGDHDPKTNATIPKCLTCHLWNVSRTVEITNSNGSQSVSVTASRLLNKVGPTRSKYLGNPPTPDWFYTAFFIGVTKHLLGYVGSYTVYDRNDPMVKVGSGIQETALAGSSEYVAMLRNLSARVFSYPPIDTQKSLKTMIEEFSQNVTLNLMSDDAFSTEVRREVTRTEQINVYTYNPRNLLLAYGAGTLASLLIVIAGMYAFWTNGVSYGSDISAVICATQNPDIKEIVGERTMGSQPLPRDIAKTKLRFGAVKRGGTNGINSWEREDPIGFGIEGTVTALK